MKKYRVLMMWKFPAWDEKIGNFYEVTAKNKSEACKYARKESEYQGHSGVRYFTAEEIKD